MCLRKSGQPRRAFHMARIQYAGNFPIGSLATAKPKLVEKPAVGFYSSDEWREVRYRALKLHGGACQCCGARGSRQSPLHVDHIKPRSKFPELALDINNLQVLCADCNLGKRAWDQTDWRVA